MTQKYFYVETPVGCGIRVGYDKDCVTRGELKRIGSYIGVMEVREATVNDINWVKSMGGAIPELVGV